MTGAPRKGAALPRHPRGWKGSVGQWLADAVSYLERRGVPEAPANAEFIMAAVLKTRRNEVKLGSAHTLRETQGFHFWELVVERGERIPLAARIFAVADVWNALRSARPYRPDWPAEKCEAYLREQAGRHFDPRVVAEFLRVVQSEGKAA